MIQKKIFAGNLVLLISFFIYLITLCPTVNVGDSGELITSSYSLGIAHPPGYPIYSLLGKIFTIISPIANIAYRVNLMSLVFASLTVFLLYLLILQLTTHNSQPLTCLTAFSASLCFAFSNTFWSQAVSSEVYALHIFFIVLIFYLLSLWNTERKYSFLTFIVFGLAFVQHYTASLMFFAIIIMLLYKTSYKKFSSVQLISFTLLVLLGLLFYLYLPIRSLANPAINWGNPENIPNIIQHLSRKQYGKISKVSWSFTLLITQINIYLKFLFAQFTPLLMIFIPFGILQLFKKNKLWLFQTIFMFILFSIGLIIILNYDTTLRIQDIVKVFFIPSFLLASLWIAFGIEFLLTFASRNLAGKWIGLTAVFLIPFIPLKYNYSENNISANYIAYNFGRNLLISPENNSIFFISQDNEVFTISYLNKVENFRSNDIKIYDELGCIYENIFGNDFLKISKKEHAERLSKIEAEIVKTSEKPVYFVFSSNLHRMENIQSEQVGLVFKIISDYKSKNLLKLNLADYRGIESFSNSKDYLMMDVIAQYYFLLGEYYLSTSEKERALIRFNKASEIGEEVEWVPSNVAKSLTDKGLMEEALQEYIKEVNFFPRKPEARYRLAFAYNKKGLIKEAIEEYKKAVELKPDYSEAHYNLGNIYMRHNMNDNAIICYLQAIKYAPDKVDAYLNLGVVYEEKREWNKAIEQYKQALILKPDYAEAMNNIAGVYMAVNQIDEAMKFYQETIKYAPSFADAYYNFGYALAKKGDIKNAVFMWKRTLQIAPQHQLAKQMLDKFDK